MTYLVVMLILVIVAGIAWYVGNTMLRSTNVQTHQRGATIKLASLAGFAILFLVGTFFSSFNQIPAGHVGVVYSFGSIIGQIEEGPQWTRPWSNVRTENIQVQSHKFKKLVCFSSETQEVYVDATLNIRVSPQAIQTLYRNIGPNWFEVIVEPRVPQNFKDETVKYTSVGIAPNREAIRHDVTIRLEKECGPHSIEVTDLLLDNIDFSDPFKQAIEKKQIATQNALEEEQKVVGERHKADQKIEAARGEGGSILVVAEKQAEANSRLAASLTPQLVQYSLVQKLGDKIEVMILPAGQNFILDPNALMKKP
ncbi:MAG: prohibitin family protein [Candidatus Zixiibacteriota bacterium]